MELLGVYYTILDIGGLGADGFTVTADLNGDALDSVCHAVHLLREGMKKHLLFSKCFLCIVLYDYIFIVFIKSIKKHVFVSYKIIYFLMHKETAKIIKWLTCTKIRSI